MRHTMQYIKILSIFSDKAQSEAVAEWLVSGTEKYAMEANTNASVLTAITTTATAINICTVFHSSERSAHTLNQRFWHFNSERHLGLKEFFSLSFDMQNWSYKHLTDFSKVTDLGFKPRHLRMASATYSLSSPAAESEWKYSWTIQFPTFTGQWSRKHCGRQRGSIKHIYGNSRTVMHHCGNSSFPKPWGLWNTALVIMMV